MKDSGEGFCQPTLSIFPFFCQVALSDFGNPARRFLIYTHIFVRQQLLDNDADAVSSRVSHICEANVGV
jgi:hypothetical protein